MRTDRDSIRTHAEERLERAARTEEHTHRVDVFRRFLKLETERLRMRHRFGLGGTEIAATRTYQVDQIVIRVCQLAASSVDLATQAELSRCAAVALGGYGRRELAPFSDVDLLFLYPGKPGEAV